MARLLVAYDTQEGQTRMIAEYIGARVSAEGHEVTVANIRELPEEAMAESYDGAFVGASIHVGQHSKRFVAFVANRRMWLEAVPVAFFSVSLSASGAESEREQAQRYVTSLMNQTGWQPQATTTLAGGLKYRSYGFLKRFMMRHISKQTGRETDTSRDFEYTDWGAVDQFTDAFLDRLTGDRLTGDRLTDFQL